MSKLVSGNLTGLAPSQIRSIEKLSHRVVGRSELVPPAFARELYGVAQGIGRRIGVLISRDGKIVSVFVGSREILYIPDLGRYRMSSARLRRLRLVFSDLSKSSDQAVIPQDIYTDLEKLRLDCVISVKDTKNLTCTYAHLVTLRDVTVAPVETIVIRDLYQYEIDFSQFISDIEQELVRTNETTSRFDKAFLVGVYDKADKFSEQSLLELKELALSAGVVIAGEIIQKRKPDPKTLLGKGKLEEVVLQCLRLEADFLIFDTELKPSQWRVITNATELKVLDRSMLILDIFSQRASSSDGRLQVELAQLRYHLPRLVEKDVGLSRLTGGIGGRGPGETKLEIGRRRIRDRIAELEKNIEKLGHQRGLRRKKRKGVPLPLVAIVGYTNAGKSTLFNVLTKRDAFAEDKLFATLDPTQGRVVLPPMSEGDGYGIEAVLVDTVGFIRDLPEELTNAFRATLEELHEADLFVHVVDGSDPRAEKQIASVEEVLTEMGVLDKPRVLVVNKCDRISSESEEVSSDLELVKVSATKKRGIDILRHTLSGKLSSEAAQENSQENRETI